MGLAWGWVVGEWEEGSRPLTPRPRLGMDRLTSAPDATSLKFSFRSLSECIDLFLVLLLYLKKAISNTGWMGQFSILISAVIPRIYTCNKTTELNTRFTPSQLPGCCPLVRTL